MSLPRYCLVVAMSCPGCHVIGILPCCCHGPRHCTLWLRRHCHVAKDKESHARSWSVSKGHERSGRARSKSRDQDKAKARHSRSKRSNAGDSESSTKVKKRRRKSSSSSDGSSPSDSSEGGLPPPSLLQPSPPLPPLPPPPPVAAVTGGEPSAHQGASAYIGRYFSSYQLGRHVKTYSMLPIPAIMEALNILRPDKCPVCGNVDILLLVLLLLLLILLLPQALCRHCPRNIPLAIHPPSSSPFTFSPPSDLHPDLSSSCSLCRYTPSYFTEEASAGRQGDKDLLLRALRKETGLSHRSTVPLLLRMNPCMFFESFENWEKPDGPGSNPSEAPTKKNMKTKESKSTKRHSSRDKAREKRDSKSASKSKAPVAARSCVPEIWKAVM